MKIFTPEHFIGKNYLNFHYSLVEKEFFCKFPRNTRYFTNVSEYHIKIDTFYNHVKDNYPYNGLFFK